MGDEWSRMNPQLIFRQMDDAPPFIFIFWNSYVFLPLIFFELEANYFTILWWFLPYIRISHGCTCVPYPDPSSHLPCHPSPQGHPSAPALSTLSHALNLDWRSITHMVIHMFQCYSLKSSILAFSHSVQKSVPYICVSFAVSHIGSSLPSF